METRVVSMRFTSDYDVRVDRRTRWGNPFIMHKEEERLEVIDLYRNYLRSEITQGSITLEDLAALHGKTLACWCAPKPCHGDVLAAAADWAYKRLAKEN